MSGHFLIGIEDRRKQGGAALVLHREEVRADFHALTRGAVADHTGTLEDPLAAGGVASEIDAGGELRRDDVA